MLNKKAVGLLVFVLIAAIIIPTQINIGNSSAGVIRINRTTASASNQQVNAGDNVNLYFGDQSIMWSGNNFYLILSRDLLTTVSSGDYIYSSMFSVANLQSSSSSYYSNNEGSWVIGSNWVNGTFASGMPAGKYSVKAFDFGAAESQTDTGSVAVTDTYITVTVPPPNEFTFQITPNNGSGGVPVTFSGSGYPALSTVDIAYYDPIHLDKYWRSVTTNASGHFSFSDNIPDLGKSNYQGDNPETFNRIQFKTHYQGLMCSVANYDQYARGLKTIGDQTAYGLFGNGTNLVSTVNAKPGSTFTISGKWFNPKDAIYVLLDSKVTMGTVTRDQWTDAIQIGNTIANNAGYFEATVKIPDSIDAGEHYIAIEDSEATLIVKILITTGTLQISPSSGSGGVTVQFTGSGYPALSTVDINYRDNLYGSWNYWTNTRADAAGNINFSTEMPDLKNNGYAGDYNDFYSQISFRSEVNGKVFSYADYTQYARGLKQVGSITASTLFGSSTNFANYGLTVKPGDTITISGRYFHPGVIYIRWDGETAIGTAAADQWRNAQLIGTITTNAQGSFEIIITIPTSYNGNHWVYIEDSQQTNFVIQIPVTGSTPPPQPTPTPIPPQPTPTQSPNKQTPTITLQCKSIYIDSGFKVDISGTLSNNNTGLANKALQLYTSKDGGRTWEALTSVSTNNEGKFSAVWVSSASGVFLFKAECNADPEYNWATAIINFAIEPATDGNKENVFTMISNSTISQLKFNSETSELSFKASGETGTTGYVSVNIPKSLINDISNLKIYLDGNQLTYSSTSQGSDAWTITITYSHSTHSIVMNLAGGIQNQNNPRFTPWIIIVASALVGAVIATVVVVTALLKKKHPDQA